MDPISLENILQRHGLLNLVFDHVASLSLDAKRALREFKNGFFLKKMSRQEREVIIKALPDENALKTQLEIDPLGSDFVSDEMLMRVFLKTLDKRYDRDTGPVFEDLNLSAELHALALDCERKLQVLIKAPTSFPARPVSTVSALILGAHNLLPAELALTGTNEKDYLSAVKAASLVDPVKQNEAVAKLQEIPLAYYMILLRLLQYWADISGDPLNFLRYRLKEQKENQRRNLFRVTKVLKECLEILQLEFDSRCFGDPEIILNQIAKKRDLLPKKMRKHLPLINEAAETACMFFDKSGPERQKILLQLSDPVREAVLMFTAPNPCDQAVSSKNEEAPQDLQGDPQFLHDLLKQCRALRFNAEYNLIIRCLNGEPFALPPKSDGKYKSKKLSLMLKALRFLKANGFTVYEDENSLKKAYLGELNT